MDQPVDTAPSDVVAGGSNERGGGGEHAARGLQYQYLRTIEELLNHLDPGSDVASVRVEGSHDPAKDGDDPTAAEIIDYELRASDGHRLLAVQVKSVVDPATSRQLGPTALVQVLLRLVRVEADRYQVLTNAPLHPETKKLVRALKQTREPGALLAALKQICHRSPTTTTLLGQLDDTALERLTRCSLRWDTRRCEQLRVALTTTLHLQRQRRDDGIGRAAAEMLLKTLLSEIFIRASAGTDEHSITAQEFRDWVTTDAATLAASRSRYDWGTVLGAAPAPPDVERPDLLKVAHSALGTDVARNGRPLALTGASGLGKTSLAVAYAHSRSGLYDIVVWLNAESAASLIASWNAICRQLDRPTDRSDEADHVAADLQQYLQTFAGTWLLILDNAPSAEAVRPWRPTNGTGHVIATTTNATSWSKWHHLKVPGMHRRESVELLHRRLREPGTSTGQSLNDLAAELEDWPLALEMAAGYLVSIQRSAGDVEDYRQVLRHRALDDSASIPEDYPRSLVAAVRLSLERVLQTSSHPYVQQAFQVTAFLSSRDIPVYLVEVAAQHLAGVLEPEEPVDPYRWRDVTHLLDELVRALAGQSLVRREPPPAATVYHQSSVARQPAVAISEIVQQIIAADMDEPSVQRALVAAAFQLQHWLAVFIDAQDTVGLDLARAHGSAIARTVVPMRLGHVVIATLFGNMATANSMRGAHHEAVAYLRYELAVLRQLGAGSEVLTLKTLGAMAANMLHADYPLSELMDVLRPAVDAARRLPDHAAGRAARPTAVYNLGAIVDTLTAARPGNRALAVMAQEVREIRNGLPASDRDTFRVEERIDQLNEMLSMGGVDPLVVDGAYALLTDEQLTPQRRLQVLGLRLEAECLLRRPGAKGTADEIRDLCQSGYFGTTALGSLLNGAMAVASFAVFDPPYEQGWTILAALCQTAQPLITAASTSSDQHRYHLCHAVWAARDPARIDEARDHLAQAEGLDPESLQIQTRRPGAELLQYLQLRLLR